MSDQPEQRRRAFPVGSGVTAGQLDRNPYPIYERMRREEPISWVDTLRMYFVVRYADVERILQDPVRFVVGTERSTLLDTFGEHMLTVDGSAHTGYKSAFLPTFQPGALRAQTGSSIRLHVNQLIDGFASAGEIELRQAFASRLPIRTMLSVFGLPPEYENRFRSWYDSFELALANFDWQIAVRERARANAQDFTEMIAEWLQFYRRTPDPRVLLSSLANAPVECRLSDEAIARNALIVFFGGISTVQATLLNALYALALASETMERVRANPALTPSVIEETIRWAGPVQSATRHVAQDTVFNGVEFRAGDTVNCMIAAANRDPAIFAEPDRFDIERAGLRRHVGFALGSHHCLGANLAKLELRIALDALFARLPGFQVNDVASATPIGAEFRQPKQLKVAWQRKQGS